jgi:hypothetical protein
LPEVHKFEPDTAASLDLVTLTSHHTNIRQSEQLVRPFGLFVAVMVLAFAGLTGSALACGNTDTANPLAAPAQPPARVQTNIVAEAAPIVVVSLHRTEPAGHRHDGPHQHDHGGATGCCMLCCSATAPHILVQDSEVFLDRPFVRAFFVAAPAAIAQAVAGLPFRPPRTA